MRGEKSFHGRERWVYTPYQGQNSVMTYAEVEDPRMPAGKQAIKEGKIYFTKLKSTHLKWRAGSDGYLRYARYNWGKNREQLRDNR